MRTASTALLFGLLLVVGVAGTPDPREGELLRTATDRPAPSATGPLAPRVDAFETVVWIGQSKPEPGDVVESRARSNSALHTVIHVGGAKVQEFDRSEDTRVTRKLRVVSCDALGPVRWDVAYTEHEFVSASPEATSSGGDATSPASVERNASPLLGRTFRLSRVGRTLRVTDEHDLKVDEGLAQTVLEELHAHAGEIRGPLDALEAALAGRALVLGRATSVPAEAARAFVDAHDDVDTAELVLTPRETRVDAGVELLTLDARFSVFDSNGGDAETTTIDLQGEVVVEVATGRARKVELTGVIGTTQVQSDAARSVEVVAQGPWTIRESRAYSRAP